MEENIDTQLIREAYDPEQGVDFKYKGVRKNGIRQILDDDVLKRVVNCIVGMDNPRIRTLTENSYVGLVIHVSVPLIVSLVMRLLSRTKSGWTKSMRMKITRWQKGYCWRIRGKSFKWKSPGGDRIYMGAYKGRKNMRRLIWMAQELWK